ncbi:MAG TPA: hypothetical protein VMD59_03740 [Acidimicrobiales bacterium]|nr:hypothetical protein [Acidimicrobiales bacterium]
MTLSAATVTSLPSRIERHRSLGSRLLWIELRRNVVPWLLPAIALVFWLDSYRQTLGQLPTWSGQLAITIGQGHTVIDFGPFVAGAAAWMGSRDGRRDTADLVTVTARSRWSGQLVTWLATTCWAVAGYAALVGALYAIVAGRVSWGGPPWWSVVAGTAGVVAFVTLGFTVGALFPGRFVAPLAAFGGFILLVMSSHAGFSDRVGAWSILPTSGQGGLGFDSGIFYPFFSGLSIARLVSLSGISLAALGVLGVRDVCGGERLRQLGAALTMVGLVATGTGVWLLSTARVEAHGAVIPALDGGASDRLIAYTPVCSGGKVPVCLQPAYRSYLGDLTSAIEPVVHETSGLPGAPVGVNQVAASYLAQNSTVDITGNPPILELALANLGIGDIGSADFDARTELAALHAFLGAGSGSGTMAQQAVQAALLSEVGVSLANQQPPLANRSGLYDDVAGPDSKGTPIYALAARLDAHPAAFRSWLATHLEALRAGRVTLEELP